MLDGRWETLKADVLVVGGGFGGLWAAIRAKEFCSSVLLVDKWNVKNIWPEHGSAADIVVTTLRKLALKKGVKIINHVFVTDRALCQQQRFWSAGLCFGRKNESKVFSACPEGSRNGSG